MKNKIIGIFVCMLMIATALPVVGAANGQNTSPAAPSLIGIKIVAKVYKVTDPDGLLGSVIQVNDTITGKYVYDSGAPDEDSNPAIGTYHYTSSSCGFEVKAGGLDFKTNPSNVNFYFQITNDLYNQDMYNIVSYNNLQLSNGMSVSAVQFVLSDSNCPAISSDKLPTTAPDLSDWEIKGVFLVGSDPSDPSKTYSIEAQVTKATKNNAVYTYQTIPTNPGLIGIKIIAKVYSIYDPDNLLGGVIELNDTISGKYVYDSGIPDSNPDTTIGHYEFTSSSCRFEVTAGGLIFKTNPSNMDLSIWIYNNHLGNSDEYTVLSLNNLQLDNGMLVTVIQWDLVDYSGTVFDNDVLPTTAPDLADWTSQNNLILVGKDPSDPAKTYGIWAHVTQATKGKAIDMYGAESGTPSIIIPYQYNIPFLQFWNRLFERFSYAFPILRNLLGY